MARKRIAVIVGSLRRDSLNRKAAQALIQLSPDPLEFEILEIGDLPLYNPDREDAPPAEWTRFRERLAAFDGLLFVTPEYNRSIPGALKNAIDVGSRPYGKNRWAGKPGAVVSVSTGALGGFGANHHLRQSLVYIDVPIMPQPEAYIGHAAELFDTTGTLADESTREFARAFMQAFARWFAANDVWGKESHAS